MEPFLKRLQLLKFQIHAWVKTLSHASKVRARLLAEKHRAELITPLDIKKYLNSVPRHRALQILHDPATTELTKVQRFNIRNTLLLDTAIQCGQRSGVLKALTSIHLRESLEVPMKSGNINMVMNIEMHKTSVPYGPAKVVITQKLYQDLVRYSNLVMARPSNGQDGCSLFTTYSGNNMSNGGINAALISVWRKCGGRQKALTSTLIRKSLTTLVSRNRPGIWASVARLLAHSVATSWHSYALVPSDPEMASTAAQMRHVVGLDDADNDDTDETFADDCYCCEPVTDNMNESCNNDVNTPVFTNSGSSSTLTWAYSNPGQDSSSSISDSEFTFDLIDPASDPTKLSKGKEYSHPRHKLSDSERAMLQQHYGHLIVAKSVTLNQFRKLSTGNASISELIKTHSLMTVYESLRSLCRK